MLMGVRLDRQAGTGDVQWDDDERVVLRVPHVRIFFGDKEFQGPGEFVVTNQRVLWVNADPAGQSFQTDVRSILLHAISKDTSVFPYPCIFCQIEGRSPLSAAASGSGAAGVTGGMGEGVAPMSDGGAAAAATREHREDDDDAYEDDDDEDDEDDADVGDDESGPVVEVRFVPSSDAELQVMFDALAAEAALHPDSDDGSDEGDGMICEDDVAAWESKLQMPSAEEFTAMVEGQFDDADEDGDEDADAHEHGGSDDGAADGGRDGSAMQ